MVFGLAQNAGRMPVTAAAQDVEEAPTEQEIMGRIVGGGAIRGVVDADDLRARRDRAENEGAFAVPFLFGD